MLRALLLLTLATAPAGAEAESVVAARTIRAQEVISAESLRLDPRRADGAATSLGQVVGRESLVAVYAGQTVMAAQLVEPALVERNQLVALIYEHAGLRITAEGRAMSRGRAGDSIRVMNLSSRSLFLGTVGPDGQIHVSPE